MPKSKSIGAWAFLIGIGLAVLTGIMDITGTWVTIGLVVSAIAVAMFNIKPAEESKMIWYTMALGVVGLGSLTASFTDFMPQIGSILTNIGAFFTSVAVIFLIVIGYKMFKN